MANPIAAWHDEHEYFKKLLQLLQQQVDLFHDGETPDYPLMLDIVAYLREYSDQFHHPREDAAFRRLAQRAPERELVLARLQQEHRVIAHAGENLRTLLEDAAGDAMLPRAEIEMSAATYLVYYGNHIAKEEEDVLPRAAQVLTDDDWKAIKAAVPQRQGMPSAQEIEARFGHLRRECEGLQAA